MKVLPALVAALAGLLLTAMPTVGDGAPRAPARAPAVAPVSPGDRTYLVECVADHALGVELSRIALVRGELPALRAFAERLSESHTRQGDAARGLAVTRGVRPPTELDEARRRLLVRAFLVPASDFDRTAALFAARLAGQLVARATSEAREGDADELRQAAAATLPDLLAEKRRADALYEALSPPAM